MRKQIHIVENIFKGEGNYIHTKIDRVFWDKKKAEEYAEKENKVSKEHSNKAGEFRVKSYPVADFPSK